MGADWTAQEVERTVGDYFAMLQAELLGQSYSKSEHRRHLLPHLQARSDAAIEFKHANISAVLVNMQQPYIAGYKPRGNYQELLEEEVERFLLRNPGFFEGLSMAPVINPQQEKKPEAVPLFQIFDSPPERIQPSEGCARRRIRITKIDFAQRDAENRTMGKLGEKFVLDLERRRLLEAHRDDLAKKVEWVSQSLGDGVGYDVVSFNETDDKE